MRAFLIIIVVLFSSSELIIAQTTTEQAPQPRVRKNAKLDTIEVHGFRAKETMQIIEHEGANPLLIDVRSEADFAAGHIKDAINVPLDQFEARVKELKKKYFDRTIITIAEESKLAMQACGILRAHKFEWAYYLKGGLASWRKENLPLVQ